jgi:hypothetical protein
VFLGQGFSKLFGAASEEKIQRGDNGYKVRGCGRRLEERGERVGVTLIEEKKW